MTTFDQLQLPSFIAKTLKSIGFVTPTPIQAKAIPPGLEGKDVLGMAQTGTGKTAAFGIPLVTRLSQEPDQNGLVLVPTRELAMQVHEFLCRLSSAHHDLRPALLIGGAPMKAQFRDLRNTRLVIATPGRLVDHLGHNPKLLSYCSMLVMDEADRMLDMGFLPQLRVILKALPKERQTLMFSATFDGNARRLANDYLSHPVHVSVGEPSKPVKKIQQVVRDITQKEKNEVILDELNAREGSVLIFTRTKHRTDRLNRHLEDCGYRVTRIHGNRTLAQRKKAIDGFRSGEFRILVATDIAARGLDIADIAHVINFDLPQVPEDYIHRIGRTARNGRGGQALTFLTSDDRGMWRSIERLTAGVVDGAGPGAEKDKKKPTSNNRPQKNHKKHKRRFSSFRNRW